MKQKKNYVQNHLNESMSFPLHSPACRPVNSGMRIGTVIVFPEHVVVYFFLQFPNQMVLNRQRK